MTLEDVVHDVPSALRSPAGARLAGGTANKGGYLPSDAVEFIGIPEWCRRVGCSLDSGYRAARRGDIPGLFRVGKLMRINWPAFTAATAETPAPVAPAPVETRVWPLPGGPSSRARGRTRAG